MGEISIHHDFESPYKSFGIISMSDVLCDVMINSLPPEKLFDPSIFQFTTFVSSQFFGFASSFENIIQSIYDIAMEVQPKLVLRIRQLRRVKIFF